MGLDLSQSVNTAQVEDEGIRITLLDERDDPYLDPETQQPITALIAGTYGKRFTTAQTRISERASRRGKSTPEQKDKDSRELWAVCVLDWDLVTNGKMADPAAIFAHKPHLLQQVVNAATGHAAFFDARSTI